MAARQTLEDFVTAAPTTAGPRSSCSMPRRWLNGMGIWMKLPCCGGGGFRIPHFRRPTWVLPGRHHRLPAGRLPHGAGRFQPRPGERRRGRKRRRCCGSAKPSRRWAIRRSAGNLAASGDLDPPAITANAPASSSGARPPLAPENYDLSRDLAAERAEAEAWMRSTFGLAAK